MHKSYAQYYLGEATYKDHSEVVKILLAEGANPNIRDFKERTALDIAILRKRNKNIEILLAHGAISNIAEKEELPHFM